jgi:hypothetical protein
MMSTMTPHDFAERLERSFAGEPPPPSLDADLASGRRRLRRRRATVAVGALAVVAVLATSYAGLVPGPRDAPVAARLTDAQVVARCLDAKVVDSWQRDGMSRGELGAVMGNAVLVTRARTTNEVYATVRAADGASWAACTLPVDGASREPRMVAVYRTDVSFPSHVVGGTRVYAPRDEGDPRVFSTGGTGPGWDVDCFPRGVPEDTRAFFEASSKCPTFHVAWNDRLPAEVAAAKVVNPDGTVGWADVVDGYLSYGYSAAMTPALRREVAETDTRTGAPYGFVRDITLYDASGDEIAHGTDTPDSDAHPTLLNYPSLAVTLNKDLR